jgi:hypothetical protein
MKSTKPIKKTIILEITYANSFQYYLHHSMILCLLYSAWNFIKFGAGTNLTNTRNKGNDIQFLGDCFYDEDIEERAAGSSPDLRSLKTKEDDKPM